MATDYEQLRQVVSDFADWLTDGGHGDLVAELNVRVGVLMPAAEKPKREADRFVEWFNREFGRRFTLNDTTVKLVRTLVVRGYKQEDIRLVALYLKHRWEADPKMHEHLVPSTILTALKFGERLDMAREWWGDKG